MTIPTLDELLAQQTALAQQIEDLRNRERAAVLTEIRALVEKHALTAEDIYAANKKRSQRKAKETSTPTYRDPETGKTWTGHGRAPDWIKGKNRAEFAIPPSE
ncbi:H-NS histone family protein [uncultured Thiocystis sp.]|jgi:DNA-binding protein H-NS|uniref:H-NS histone family protein n=1 Tax=uncultured Thiocystis sp. TaxID=1202134 RepID=UPI0025F46026|nr:H-NS histone family protein [uncultured Thiocystis sp.]